MIVTHQSHLDHGLTVAHLAHVLALFAAKNAFFLETIELPADLASVACGLYGPVMGDPRASESETFFARRGTRAGDSRMIALPPRPCRQLTVIGGPAGDQGCVLYTTFGGPSAPREPWEVELLVSQGKATPEELAASKKFWNDHALSSVGT